MKTEGSSGGDFPVVGSPNPGMKFLALNFARPAVGSDCYSP
jgi:hypothetical protein